MASYTRKVSATFQNHLLTKPVHFAKDAKPPPSSWLLPQTPACRWPGKGQGVSVWKTLVVYAPSLARLQLPTALVRDIWWYITEREGALRGSLKHWVMQSWSWQFWSLQGWTMDWRPREELLQLEFQGHQTVFFLKVFNWSDAAHQH